MITHCRAGKNLIATQESNAGAAKIPSQKQHVLILTPIQAEIPANLRLNKEQMDVFETKLSAVLPPKELQFAITSIRPAPVGPY